MARLSDLILGISGNVTSPKYNETNLGTITGGTLELDITVGWSV